MPDNIETSYDSYGEDSDEENTNEENCNKEKILMKKIKNGMRLFLYLKHSECFLLI